METNYGARIRLARKRRGLTQHALARRLGLTKQAITQLERGTRQPSADRLVALATVLGVSSDFLLGLDEEHMDRVRTLGGRARLHRWVQWQALRRHTQYGPAVHACVQACPETRADLATLTHTLHHEPWDPAWQTGTPVLLTGAWQAAALIVAHLCEPVYRDQCPPLADFARTWGIRLPLAPGIEDLPAWLASQVFPRPYEIRRTFQFQDTRYDPHGADYYGRLTVDFYPGVSRTEMIAAVVGELRKHAPWEEDGQERGQRVTPSQDHYIRLFAIYDHHTKKKATLRDLAHEYWPEELALDKPSSTQKPSAVQRVSDAIAAVQALIEAAKRA
jgi:transcriptional regulator with XRE-family HTH domain